jgi:hypothetical protein
MECSASSDQARGRKLRARTAFRANRMAWSEPGALDLLLVGWLVDAQLIIAGDPRVGGTARTACG